MTGHPRRSAGAGVSGAVAAALDEGIAQHQHVHVGAQEAIQGLLRAADHRFILVERGIQQDGHPGQLAEGADQRVVARVRGLVNGLQPP